MPNKNIKVLFFGDIMGKIGRKALKKIIPELKKKYSPDLIIANGENLAHGISATKKTINEVREAGVDFFTAGNHIWEKEEGQEILESDKNFIRPANCPDKLAGHGWQIVKVGNYKLLIICLLGRTYIEKEVDFPLTNPFTVADDIIKANAKEELNGIIVDFHAEATSDKVAMGWHLDGKVSAVLGTHTHVPTADAKIMPQGTAHVTDIGMVGGKETVIGVSKDNILNSFVNEVNWLHDIPEKGACLVNAVLVTIDPKTKLAKSIERIDEEVEIE